MAKHSASHKHSASLQHAAPRTNTRRKKSAWRPAAMAVVGGSVLAATGFGIWASLSATTANANPQQIATGTLKLTMAANGTGFTSNISNLAPGDTVNRYVDLTNGGSLDAKALTLSTTTSGATGSGVLVNDGSTTKALRVSVTSCDGAWSASAGTCGGNTTTLLAPTALGSLNNAATLISGSLPAGSEQHLRIAVQLPDQDETTVNGALPSPTVQGQSVNVTYTFSETQRTAATTNS